MLRLLTSCSTIGFEGGGFPLSGLENGCQRSNRTSPSTNLWYAGGCRGYPSSSCPTNDAFMYNYVDAIDNGQFKKAVQLADKMMKKQSDLICAKVTLCTGTA